MIADKYSLNISYKHRKTGIESKKTIVLSAGEENSLENILRLTFNIPSDEGVLLNCKDTIFYPVSMVNIDLVARADLCELQSFSMAAMHVPQKGQLTQSENRPTKKSRTTNKSSSATSAPVDNSKEDKRKFNRGLDQRRSYLKEEKLFVMIMKDCGKSAEDISNLSGVSKSNVEKWCSDKIREKIIPKWKQESKNIVIDELLREKKLHFATNEPIKFKLLIEFLASKLYQAQQNSNSFVRDFTFNIPNNIFWKFSDNIEIAPGQSISSTLFSMDGMIDYVIEQGYFFNYKKKGGDNTDSSVADKSSHNDGEYDDNDSLSATKNQAGYDYMPSVITPPSVPRSNGCSKRNQSQMISSEESDVMDLGFDDNQSIASMNWLTSNPSLQQQQFPQVPIDYDTNIKDFDPFDLHDSDFDTDEYDEAESNREMDELSLLLDPNNENSSQEIMQLMIRQGVIPKCKQCRVSNKPKTTDELLQLLADDYNKNSQELRRSDFTMQVRDRFMTSVPIAPEHPEYQIPMSMTIPVHEVRALLGNTKFLTEMRDRMSGKVQTEEDKEDMAVLSLLGE